MDLNASLYAATADPPPTRIDLDVLIRAEERRGYRQRRLFGAGVVSGVAVLVGAASVGWQLGTRAPIGEGAGPVCPWVSPSGDPSSFANLPPMASASPVMPPRSSEKASPSGSASYIDPTGHASPPPSAGDSDPPNVEASGSPASAPPASPPPPPSVPSASASGSASGPSYGPPPTVWASDLIGPGASYGPLPTVWASDLIGRGPAPAGVCADTLRRLEHVLIDALARVAPDAHPLTPIRFFSYADGSVRAVVPFDGGGDLEVILFPLWADSDVNLTLSRGGAYQLRSPGHGLVIAFPTAGPLTSAQIEELANDPGLTLTP